MSQSSAYHGASGNSPRLIYVGERQPLSHVCPDSECLDPWIIDNNPNVSASYAESCWTNDQDVNGESVLVFSCIDIDKGEWHIV